MAIFLTRFFHVISSIGLVLMMLVVVGDVCLRFIFNIPIRGAYDMVSVGLMVMVFFGIGPVIASRNEILIDLLDNIIPPSALLAIRKIASIGTFSVFLFIGWSMILPATDAWRYGERSLELGIPIWVLWSIAFIGLLGTVIISIFTISKRKKDIAEVGKNI
jgi:TRAP-type C4-dicarboxylate transport system permease small subunit